MKLKLVLLLLSIILDSNYCLDQNDWKTIGNCKGMWRPEKLPGRCFGLKIHSTYDELKNIGEITSAPICKALCCNFQEKCISWQYESQTKECKLGPGMRLGNESAGIPGWCEPTAPIKWRGRRIEGRTTNGTCTSGERLQVQCFGLGDEKKLNGNQMTVSQCEQACCAAADCDMWQAAPGRGCYYSSKKGVGCDDRGGARYEGGRKCVSGLCGGMEDQLLSKRNGTKHMLLK